MSILSPHIAGSTGNLCFSIIIALDLVWFARRFCIGVEGGVGYVFGGVGYVFGGVGYLFGSVEYVFRSVE